MVFSRNVEMNSKTCCLSINDPKIWWRFTQSFWFFFGIPPNVGLSCVFSVTKSFKKRHKNIFKILTTVCEWLQIGVKNHAKLTQTASKTDAKWTRKIMHSGLASAKNTPQRVTCQNASKCVHFYDSRCYFAHEKCQKHAKYIQNACKFNAKWARKNMDCKT